MTLQTLKFTHSIPRRPKSILAHIMADWSRHFDEPIALPDGGERRTLQDAGHYVDKLPRGLHEREEWQTVMEVLLSGLKAVGR